MSKFTKEEAIAFCKKCYKNEKGQCVYHRKNKVDNTVLYNSIGCTHQKLDAANYYCDVCGEAPKKWDEDKESWITLPFTAIKTSEDGKSKKPPTDNTKEATKDFKLPENAVNCSVYHKNMMDCVKHSECNYCQMPGEKDKDMKCISNNMKDKLTSADVVDAYSCIDKAQFNNTTVDQIDKVGVNSTNYNSYYKLKVSDYTKEFDGYDQDSKFASYNDTTQSTRPYNNGETQSESNNNKVYDNAVNEIMEETDEEEKRMASEEKRTQNESSRTNNNDESQFFFLGENPSVAESVKYHFDEGYFFDTYTEHGVAFNDQSILPEYDEEVLEKNIENDATNKEQTNVETFENNVEHNNNIQVVPKQNIKQVVSFQKIIHDMENTTNLLNYGLIAIVCIMILLFIVLVLKRK